jgi:hypothetical protein
MDNRKLKAQWVKDIKKVVLNRQIVKVRYMTNEEVEHMGWYAAAVVFQLSDGTLLFPSRDDEGNDAGAIFTTNDNLPTIPVI